MIKQKIKVNLYEIISERIESGVRYGYNRAFKYTDTPDIETIVSEIENAIMLELSEIIEF